MNRKIAFQCVIFGVLFSSAWTAPESISGGNPQTEDQTNRDSQALNYALLQSGGPPGKVPIDIFPVENPGPTDPYFWDHPIDDPCTVWAYEYTNILRDGIVRHEHAVVRYQGTNHEVLDVAGYYAKSADRDGQSFVVDYYKQGGNATRHSLDVNCKTEEWGVLNCYNCLKSDYVIHGHQEPSCREAGTAPLTPLGTSTLEDLVGVRGLPRYKIPHSFNSSQLLEYFGGAPGNFPPTHNQSNVQAPPEPQDPKQRPLPDAPRESWVYSHWQFYLPYAIRLEHATTRFVGKPSQFIDVRGVLYWRSNVGDFRVEYRQDDTGFHSHVDAADCDITRGLWKCVYPKRPEGTSGCGAGVPTGLLATLVG